MRRIAIGLVFLLGACADKPEQAVGSISWNEYRSLSDQQQEVWSADNVNLDRANWNAGSRALSASALRIPDLAEPPHFDGTQLGKFTPTESQSFSATASNLQALTGASSQVVRFHPDEASRLSKAAPVSFPTEWQ